MIKVLKIGFMVINSQHSSLEVHFRQESKMLQFQYKVEPPITNPRTNRISNSGHDLE